MALFDSNVFDSDIFDTGDAGGFIVKHTGASFPRRKYREISDTLDRERRERITAARRRASAEDERKEREARALAQREGAQVAALSDAESEAERKARLVREATIAEMLALAQSVAQRAAGIDQAMLGMAAQIEAVQAQYLAEQQEEEEAIVALLMML